MVEVRQLMEYNEAVRHRYFDALAKLPWKEFVKNREASFRSLRNILIHTMEAMDYWLDFLQKEKCRSDREFDEYSSFQDVKVYMMHVETRMRLFLDSLSSQDLKRKYVVKGDAGKRAQVTAEDVLVHVFEEEVHHRGELIALLWQMGVEPPLMGWKGL